MSTAFEHNRATQELPRTSIFQRHRRMRNRNERSNQWFQISRNDELRNGDIDENSIISFDNNPDHFPIRLSALRAIVVDSNGFNNNGINTFDHYYMRNALRSLDHDYISSVSERYSGRRRNYFSGGIIPFNREGSSHYLEEVLHFLENTLVPPLTWDHLNSQNTSFSDNNYVKIEYTSWLKCGSIFQGVQTFSGQVSVFLSESSLVKDERKIKVIIQDINFSGMSLSGQIEVFNTSDVSFNGSIMIWWNGEIVDFVGYYNLLAVKRGIAWKTDVAYWRKLEPFKGMDDYEFLNLLFTKEKISDICNKYIFMRWKESEFIGPSMFGNELTTSGSYFCCLRRNDGFIEGYYFDPSTSCQYINLYPKMDDGVFKFR